MTDVTILFRVTLIGVIFILQHLVTDVTILFRVTWSNSARSGDGAPSGSRIS